MKHTITIIIFSIIAVALIGNKLIPSSKSLVLLITFSIAMLSVLSLKFIKQSFTKKIVYYFFGMMSLITLFSNAISHTFILFDFTLLDVLLSSFASIIVVRTLFFVESKIFTEPKTMEDTIQKFFS